MFSNQDIKKLLIPLVIEQILLMLVGLADTAMISQAGEAAISGVALVDMFAYMIITILTAASAGGAVIVSQYLGADEKPKANLAARQLLSALAFNRQNTVYLSWDNICHFRWAYMRRILHIALPNGIENGLFALGKLLVTSIVAIFGTAQIAANGVANELGHHRGLVGHGYGLAGPLRRLSAAL